METYTVRGHYKDNDQPYAAAVEASTEAEAVAEAQRACREENGWVGESLVEEPLWVESVWPGEPSSRDPEPGVWTVLSVYEDNDQPYESVVRAPDAAGAIAAAVKECREANGWTPEQYDESAEWFRDNGSGGDGEYADYDTDPLIVMDVVPGDMFKEYPGPDGTWYPTWEGDGR